MSHHKLHSPDTKDRIDNPDAERRDAPPGATPTRTSDGIENSPPGIAAKPHRQKDNKQLTSGAGLELLKGSSATGLRGRASVSSNVEGQVGQE
jgi:hypothetical protein